MAAKKNHYSATFMNPDTGLTFTIHRRSLREYGAAWVCLDNGVIRGDGFSRDRALANREAGRWLRTYPKAHCLVVGTVKHDD